MRFLCVLLGLVVWCGCCFADSFGRADLRDYVYDEQGNPVFIKIYVRSVQPSASKQDVGCKDAQAVLTRMVQEDQRGSYVVVPIKKKKSKDKDADDDEDKDESFWECPHCGTINKSTEHSCSKKGCPFHSSWPFL